MAEPRDHRHASARDESAGLPAPVDPRQEPAERFRHTFETVPIGIGHFTTDGRWLEVNQCLLDMLGYSREELETLRYPDFTHPDDIEADAAGRARLLAGEIAFHRMEKRYIRKDRRIVWAILTMTLAQNATGRVAYFVGAVEDITERKEAEAKLEESEQRYRSFFEHHHDAVFSFDLAGSFASANPACESLSGYRPQELVGRPIAPLIVPEHLDRANAGFRAAAAGEAQVFEVTIRHKSGREVDVSVTCIPIVVHGSVVGLFGVGRDMTPQHALEAHVRHAQKMEAIGQLAGGIAHDFNNLLSAIVSHSEFVLAALAAGSPGGEELREDVEVIRHTAERATALTRQLLAVGRRQAVELRLVDLNAMARQTERLLRRTLGEGVTLRTDLQASGSVLVDTGQLEQVLMNLAVNARDAMPVGGTLMIRTRDVGVDDTPTEQKAGLRPGRYVTVEVEDTGVGIPPELQARIFEPFFTTKGVGQGSGLGLAMVHGLVHQWEGAVTVTSVPGRGTTFTVYLPRQASPPAPGPRPGTMQPGAGNETVLVVEDEEPVRSSMRRILSRYGYTVLEAKDGAEALKLLDAAPRPIDLVITDLVMPEMGGREFLAKLRARGGAPRVLVVSGYDEGALRGDALPPNTHFLEKPFTSPMLLRSVRAALESAAAPGDGLSGGH